MVTQQTAIAIAYDLINAIRASGFPLRKAVLFGSFARNEQHKHSDIDLALVADEFTGNPYFDTQHIVKELVSDKRFYDIETHTFNFDRFEKGGIFIDEIKRTGIVLFSDVEEPAHLQAA
ncbi:MAG: nucleotidyltransferase domain-containing protein [Bacteroidota bacterium]|mgnify:CR=1 FL=1